MRILAIESSCDETAAAVVEDGIKIISNVVATSTAMHEKYGGIVPEVAAREQLRCIMPVIIEALSPIHEHHQHSHRTHYNMESSIVRTIEPKNLASIGDTSWLRKSIETYIDAVAVTVGPGLIGSLLIGTETAKTIAFVTGKQIIPVNHVLAHMYANFVNFEEQNSSLMKLSNNNVQMQLKPGYSGSNQIGILFPAISLVVSGGHTELFLMTSEKNLKWLGGTLDDAAGEAFDKTARLLGFGNLGGAAIQEAAVKAAAPNPFLQNKSEETELRFPRPIINDGTLNFSFSGLKTAVLREFSKLKIRYSNNTYYYSDTVRTSLPPEVIQVLAHEIQEAISDVLVAKTVSAANEYHAKSILISGGVAANLRLREKMQSTISHEMTDVRLSIPPVALCTDNAVYIGSYAFFRGKKGSWQSVEAEPDLSVEDI